ncbi:hypothetical protein SAMN04487995_5799 [Dyadobacter koreensis]|uniref:Collagen triple helix repeat-containing protein n=1 Tax=Dyadobacter koreensis TaxID=408657 RepID=A0A1H7APE6_9BACT|nr:collagen-like protein [Dyadobacter koreensis]SEJ67208.1 hypothetical protein SAMN04487995_5799 [Dyadobacter koreensis]
MKNFIKLLTPSVLFASVMLLIACAGSDGEVGPKGDAGEAGTAGPKGDPGSANVIYSAWIPTTFSGSGSSYTGSITAPKLTQEMLDKADIRVYWSEGGRVISMPYAQTIGGTAYSVHQRFFVGRIDLIASYAVSQQSFRYIIIPGGVAARQKPLSQMSYEEVKYFYGIND